MKYGFGGLSLVKRLVAMRLDMPAVHWKIQNLQKLKAPTSRKFQQQAAVLHESLKE
jgi:hypothetical protein